MKKISIPKFLKTHKLVVDDNATIQTPSQNTEISTEKVIEKIVEKEVPIASRLTFAHDKELCAYRYYLHLNAATEICFDELKTNTIFTISPVQIKAFAEQGGVEGEEYPGTVYPVFKKMTSNRLIDKLFPHRNIICIGGIRVSTSETNSMQIIGFTKRLTGKTLGQIIREYNTENVIDTTSVYKLNSLDSIRVEEIEGDISYDDYRLYHAIDSTIDLVLYDGWY